MVGKSVLETDASSEEMTALKKIQIEFESHCVQGVVHVCVLW